MSVSAAEMAKAVMEMENVKLQGLADLLGTSVSTVWRIVNGKVDPRAVTYQRLQNLYRAAA